MIAIRTIVVTKSKSLCPGVLLHADHNIILMSIFWGMTVQDGLAPRLVSETGIITPVVYITFAIVFWKFLIKKQLNLAI